MMQIWVSASKAKELGCTHRARFMGIIPGFYGENEGLWVSRSDLLCPIEDVLVFIWATVRRLRGEQPDFMFEVVGPI
jgi:hypothetical protein